MRRPTEHTNDTPRRKRFPGQKYFRGTPDLPAFPFHIQLSLPFMPARLHPAGRPAAGPQILPQLYGTSRMQPSQLSLILLPRPS